MKSGDITILFLSCDKYSDLWKSLFYCFHANWRNCPYPLYLGSNTVSYRDSKVKTLLSGPDKDWSSSLLLILNQITTQYVFIWLDDIFPVGTVSSADFARSLDFMKKNKAKHVHIQPSLTPDSTVANGKFGVIEKGAPYRVSALGFWDVSSLKSLLIPGESPWNFEIMGSYRSRYSDGFYILMKPLFDRIHVVEKGRYFKEAAEYCKTHTIPLSTNKRPVLSNTIFVKSELQKIYFNSIVAIPWKIRLSLMNILRKLLISY